LSKARSLQRKYNANNCETATNGSLVSIAQRNMVLAVAGSLLTVTCWSLHVVQVTAIPIAIATASILIKKIEEE